jgi:hypothetical protein
VSRVIFTTDSGPPSARTTRRETWGRGAIWDTAITIVPERKGALQEWQRVASSGFSASQRGQKVMARLSPHIKAGARLLALRALLDADPSNVLNLGLHTE